MNAAPMQRLLLFCVVAAILLTAGCPLYFAGSLIWLYLGHGQPILSALYVTSGALWWVAAYVVAAVLYALAPRLRPALALIAAAIAIYAIAQVHAEWSMVQQRNLFHNLLAEPIWEMFGRCAVAVLAVTHLIVARRERYS